MKEKNHVIEMEPEILAAVDHMRACAPECFAGLSDAEALAMLIRLGLKGEEKPSMSNNERFNHMLNSCRHPRQVYNALSAFPKEEKQV